MKLTPLDIHHKEFRHSIRGYSEDEVDQFLDEVADEFERLFKENIDLSEKLEAANDKVRTYIDMEKTLHNTMLAAQQSAEDIKTKADREAELMLRDAELKAKELVHAALAERQKAQSEFGRIKAAEDDFRIKFRDLLEVHLRGLAEIPVPEDVQTLASQPQPEWSPPPLAVDVPDAEPVEMAQAQPSEQLSYDARPTEAEGAAPSEPPASGFVTSVHLGEMGPPDVAEDDPPFPEPPEFALTSFGSGGERDEDVDIEEID